jgi:hypothetical protein
MDFETIEDGMLGKLKADRAYLKKCETYSGQLEADIDIQAIVTPAAFVVYSGSPAFELVDGPTHNEQPVFSVFVAAKDLRGNTALRKGDNGCYKMIKDVLASLVNFRVDESMLPLAPRAVELVRVKKDFAAYRIDFSTAFDTEYQWP